MKAQALNRDEATPGYKWAAARDAQTRSAVNESNYTQKEKIVADRMKIGLEACYRCEEVFITYRVKFISVKVSAIVGVVDKKGLKIREADWEKIGVTKHNSPQGITYRIPKV